MKQLKTILLIALALLGTTLQAQAAPELSLSSAILAPGGTGTLDLTLSGGTEPYAGVNTKILLPQGITVEGLSKGALLSSGFVTDYHNFSDDDGDGVSLIAYSGTSTFTASTSGVMLTLSLRAPTTAQAGNFDASFISSKSALSNADGTAFTTPSVSSGSITIESAGDSDNDGLPDWWEEQYFGNLDQAPNSDPDGDGRTNQQEYVDGSNPSVDDQGSAEGQIIPLVTGWNWISFNRLPADTSVGSVLSNYPAQNEDAIKTTPNLGGTATYYDGTWYGLEDEGIKPGVMYLLYVQSENPDDLENQGEPVDVSGGIDIVSGWNWIGFSPQAALSIGIALDALSPSDEDEIKTAPNLGGSATYYGTQWWPKDYELKPGIGYLLNSITPDTLIYPDGAGRRYSARTVLRSPRSAPSWENPEGLQYTMILHAKIELADGTPVEADGGILAVFKENQYRGVVEIAEGPAGQWFQLTMASDETTESGFHLKVYDAGTDRAYDIEETIDFTADETLGKIFEPLVYIAGDPVPNLGEAIPILKVLVGMETGELGFTKDINGDEVIGLEEVVYILQRVSDLRVGP